MTTNQVPIRIVRAKSDPPLGGDLFGWIDVVWDAVAREFEAFGARDVWDVWPMEVHLDHVIVQDMGSDKFYRANIKVDKDTEKVSFSDVERVVSQWITVDDGQVERGEIMTPPELQTALVSRRSKPTTFGNLLGL